MGTILKWLMSAVLGPILGAVSQALRDRQARADAVARGQADQLVVDQAAALSAHERMQQAESGPKGREVTQDALEKGSF